MVCKGEVSFNLPTREKILVNNWEMTSQQFNRPTLFIEIHIDASTALYLSLQSTVHTARPPITPREALFCNANKHIKPL